MGRWNRQDACWVHSSSGPRTGRRLHRRAGSALQGVAALANDGRYVGPPNYLYKFELTGWGWIYLVIGVFAVPVGVAVFTGQLWGRVVAILLAGVSLVVNFMFIPWYPLWSVLMIALDIAVIWALVLHQHRWR